MQIYVKIHTPHFSKPSVQGHLLFPSGVSNLWCCPPNGMKKHMGTRTGTQPKGEAEQKALTLQEKPTHNKGLLQHRAGTEVSLPYL